MDALEYVRQLFAAGCIQSAFWHSIRSHRALARSDGDPEEFGIAVVPGGTPPFAQNEVAFTDPARRSMTCLARGFESCLQLHAGNRAARRCTGVVRYSGSQALNSAHLGATGSRDNTLTSGQIVQKPAVTAFSPSFGEYRTRAWRQLCREADRKVAEPRRRAWQ